MNHLKGYASTEEAARSKAGLQPGAVIKEDCRVCGLVHVRQPKKTAPARDIPRPVRDGVLRRDRHSCVRCGKSVEGRPYSLHHRKRRGQSGEHVAENLLTMCGDGVAGCHGWVHANIAQAREAGWILLSTDDPAAVPVEYLSEHRSGLTVLLTPDYGWSMSDGGVSAA